MNENANHETVGDVLADMALIIEQEYDGSARAVRSLQEHMADFRDRIERAHAAGAGRVPDGHLVQSGSVTLRFDDGATAQAQAFELRKGGYPAVITPFWLSAAPDPKPAADSAVAFIMGGEGWDETRYVSPETRAAAKPETMMYESLQQTIREMSDEIAPQPAPSDAQNASAGVIRQSPPMHFRPQMIGAGIQPGPSDTCDCVHAKRKQCAQLRKATDCIVCQCACHELQPAPSDAPASPQHCQKCGFTTSGLGRCINCEVAPASPQPDTPKHVYITTTSATVVGDPNSEDHSCDAMGCGHAHVLARLPFTDLRPKQSASPQAAQGETAATCRGLRSHTVTFEAHWLQTIAVAAKLLEQSACIMDQREGAALRKLLASAKPGAAQGDVEALVDRLAEYPAVLNALGFKFDALISDLEDAARRLASAQPATAKPAEDAEPNSVTVDNVAETIFRGVNSALSHMTMYAFQRYREIAKKVIPVVTGSATFKESLTDAEFRVGDSVYLVSEHHHDHECVIESVGTIYTLSDSRGRYYEVTVGKLRKRLTGGSHEK